MSYNYNVPRDLFRETGMAQEKDGALNAVPIQQRKSFSFQLFVAFLFLLFGAKNTFAQTTIINAAQEGGFESGTTLTANGWTAANDDLDKWFVGDVQTPASGSRGAYISDTNGASYTYSLTPNPAQYSMFYREVTVPAGETAMTLSFKWKNMGKNADNGDRIQVFVTPQSFTPIAGQIPAVGHQLTPNLTSGPWLASNSEYRTTTYVLPKSYAGTTFKLIFSFKTITNTSTISVGAAPAAIDDISLVSKAPGTITSIASGNWSDPATWAGGIVPQGEDVVIAVGHTVKIDMAGDTTNASPGNILPGSATANNLTINGTLTFGEVAPLFTTHADGLQINGNLVVNAGGNFDAYYFGRLSTAIKIYKTFLIGGNLTNNGRMDIFGSEMYLVKSNIQTIEGSGEFTNTNDLVPTYSNTMFVKNLRIRNSNVATPNVIWNLDTKVANLIEMRQARVQLGANKVMTYGISVGSEPASMILTEDAGFLPGTKFVRFWFTSDKGYGSSMTNVDLTVSGKGKYPFVNLKGENRSLYLRRENISNAINGEIGVTYNDAATVTSGLTITDGTTTITNRYNGNWIMTDSGTGNTVNTVAVQAPGVFNTAQTTGVARVMYNGGVFGTHAVGNKLPTAVRANVSMADLTKEAIYMGASANELLPAATVTSVTSGNWNAGSTWSTGIVPSASDIVTIASGHTVTANSAGNVCKNATISSGATLINASGDLTIGANALRNNTLINNGTLTVSGGTLTINGNSVHNPLSTFNHSGGDIIVDGNDEGNTATSVATGVPMMKIMATQPSNLNWTGGTITFVDPHASLENTTTTHQYVLTVNQYGNLNSASPNHTVRFGNGVSTTPAGTTEGFKFYLKPDSAASTAYFRMGKMVVDAGASNYRVVQTGGQSVGTGFEGDLIINTGSTLIFPNAGLTYCVNGNFVNNGTFVNRGILYMGMLRGNYIATGASGPTFTGAEDPCPNPQSISGSGVFATSTIVPTYGTGGLNITSALAINNSSASGVTLNVPLNLSGATSLYLIRGKLNTSNVNLLTIGTPASIGKVDAFYNAANVDTYVNGPLACYVKNSNTLTTYVPFPVGKSSSKPFNIALTTPATGPFTLIKVEAIESNTGTTDATATNLANTRWDVTSSGPLGLSSVVLGDANIVSGMIPVQAASASGVYTAAFGNTATFSTSTPNTLQSTLTAQAAAFNSYSYAQAGACTGTPVAGNAAANGTTATRVVNYGGAITLSLPNAVVSSNLIYQWEGSADNVTYSPLAGLTTATAYTKHDNAISYYRCKVTCGASTAISGSVKVTLIPAPVFDLTKTNTAVCSGSRATITTTQSIGDYDTALYDVPQGGIAIAYGSATNTVTTPPLTATKTFYVDITDAKSGNATYRYTSTRTPITIVVSAAPAAPTADAQTFCNSSPNYAPKVVDLKTTSGTGIKWYTAATGGTALDPTASLSTQTYYAAQAITGCESERTPVIITVIGAPTLNSTTQNVCSPATVATLAATGVSGSTIKWYSAQTGGYQWASTDQLVAGTYFASQTTGECESVRSTAVTVTVGTTPSANPTGTAAVKCDTGAPITLNDIAPFTPAHFKWYDAQTGGNLVPRTTVLPNNTTATYYVSSSLNGCESTDRLAVTPIISSVLAPIAASSQNICGVNQLKNIVATPNPSTATVTYEYYGAPTGGTALTDTTIPTNGTTYYVSQTIGTCKSVQRTAVTVNYSSPSAPTFPSPSQGFCSVGSTPTVADLAVSVPSGSTVKWYDGSGVAANLLATTTALTHNKSYYAAQVDAQGCESSTAYRAGVTVILTSTAATAPTVPAAQSFPNGATVANLYPNTSLNKWYDALTGGNLLSANTALQNGTSYYVSQMGGSCESTRSAVAVTLGATLPAAPTVSNTTQSFCTGATVANLATGTTGVTINWYKTATGGLALESAAALTTNTYYFASQVVNGAESIERTPVYVMVNSSTTPAPSAPSSQLFCGSGKTVADLVADGQGIKWYNAATNGTLVALNTPLTNGGVYYPTQTYAQCETPAATTRNSVTVTLGASAPAEPSGTAAPALCFGATLGDISLTGSNIKWYDAAANGNVLAKTTAVVSGTTYYASQSNGCESTARFAVTPTVGSPIAAPTANATQVQCSGAKVSDLAATATGTLRWYKDGSFVANTVALTTGIYYAEDLQGSCVGPKTAVSVTVLPAQTAPTASAQSFCGSAKVSDLVASGANIKWYAAATGGIALNLSDNLTNATTYHASQSNGTCESATRTAVLVTISTDPSLPTVGATQTYCGAKTVADLIPAPSATNKWYSAASGGTALATTDVLKTGNYYVSQVNGGCESTRVLSSVTVNVAPATPVVTSVTQPTCSVSTATAILSGLPASGTWTINPGAITGTGTSKTITGITAGNKKFTVTDANGCISAETTQFTVTAPTAQAAPTVAITQPTCMVATGSVDLSGLPSGAWIINPGNIIGTGTTKTITGLAIGSYNYTVTNTAAASGCTSPAVPVVINTPVLAAPVLGTVTQPTCSVATGSFAITNFDASYTYAFTPSTGVTNTAGTVSAPAGTYTVIAKVGTCTSVASASATVDAQPATPVQPTVGSVTQPTCSVATGSFAITNYNAAYTYAFTPSVGVTNNGATVTAPAGAYTVTATLGTCTSVASANATVNAQPVTPVQPTVGSVTQPTCSVATGSFAITNYDAAYTYVFTPSVGVTNNGGTVTAPAGTYTVTATLGACTSTSSANVVVNQQTVTPAPTGISPQVFDVPAKVSDINVTLVQGGTVQWYNSTEDAAANTGAIDPNTLLVSGKTYYGIQTAGGCRSALSLAVLINGTLAVDQFEAVRMEYYPNPVVDKLNIAHTNVISSIEVFNLLGQRVLTARPNTTSTKIDMSDLPIGTYLVEVQSEGKTTTLKVVKNQ